MMLDVLIVGAGPAGAVAAHVLARAGRARPHRRSRDVSARQAVRRHGQSRARSRCCDGCDVCGRRRRARPAHRRHACTGGAASSIEGRYPRGLHGRALAAARSRLDAAAARRWPPARSSSRRRRAPRDRRGHERTRRGRRRRGRRPTAVSGTLTRARDDRRRRPAFDDRVRPRARAASARGRADGRSARISRHAERPDRRSGEMHVRRGRYIGVAPVPGGLDQRLSGQAIVARRSRRCAMPRALLAARSAPIRAARSVRGRAARRRRRSCSVRSRSTSRDEAIDGLLLAGDAGGLHRSDDRRRPAVRGPRRRARGGRRAGRARARVGRRPRASRRRRRRAFGPSTVQSGAARARVVAAPAGPCRVHRARRARRFARTIARAGDCDMQGDGSRFSIRNTVFATEISPKTTPVPWFWTSTFALGGSR